MGEELDYTTLKWVKDEIQESLDQTRQALETYVENPDDATQVRFCATYLHQVYGTLQMVEIYGGALLAEEMEKLASALLNNEVGQKDDAYDVLMRAILQLPVYLEGLEQGQMDMPVVLLPLLNDLRAARGENLLSENAFFLPDLTVIPPQSQLSAGKTYPDIQIYARKLRPVYQASLLGWYRDRDAVGSLKKLAAILRELQNASKTHATQRLWWIAGGVIEALIDAGLDTGTSVKLLMGHVDLEIKRLIRDGESVFEQSPPTELLKNCLYYVGTAQSDGPRVSSLKQAFNLEQLLPYSGALEEAMDNLKGSSADLMGSVSVVIKEDLLTVKDQLDIFVRNAERDVTTLAPMGGSLRRIADTLAMLGLGDLRRVIQQQVELIADVVGTGDVPDDQQLMEMASALLFVEASLDNMGAAPQTRDDARAAALGAQEEELVLMPVSEQAQLTNLVIQESRELIAEVKEGFNTFAVESASFGPIEDVPGKLAQIKGALAIMNLDRAAALMGVAIQYVRDDMLTPQQVPEPVALDSLADVITSIEYYLEAIEQGSSHPETLLAVAELSANELGYPLSTTPAAETSEVLDEVQVALETDTNAAAFSLDLDAQFDVGETETPAIEDAADALQMEPEHAALPANNVQEAEPEAEHETLELGADDSLAFARVEDLAETAVDDDTSAEIEDEESFVEPAASPAVVTIGGDEDEFAADIEADVDEEILEIFIEEADEVLGVMTDNLLAWRADPDDHKPLETLRRSYHTLKGSGRLAGAVVTGDYAWSFESMLNRVMDGKIETSPEMFKLLELSEPVLQGLIAHLKGEAERRPAVKRMMALAEALSEGGVVTMADLSGKGFSPAEDLSVDEEAAAEEPLPETNEWSLSETPSVDEESAFIESVVDEAESVAEDEALSLDTPDSDEAFVASEPTGDVAEPEFEPEPEPAFDPVLAEVFRKETESHLESLLEFITGHSAVGPFPVSDDLHRALHTLHGSARMAGVPSIAVLSEPMDRYVRTLLERDIPFDHEGLATLEELMDALADALAVFDQPNPSQADHADLLARVTRMHEEALAQPRVDVEAVVVETIQDVTPAASELSEDDEALREVFLEEADEILASSHELLQRWPDSLHDAELVHELQRAMHTLKGSARLANIPPIGDLSHEIEVILEGITEERRAVDTDLPPIISTCLDWLQTAVSQVRSGEHLEPASEHLAALAEWPAESAAAAEPVESTDATQFLDVGTAFDERAEEPVSDLAEAEMSTEADELELEPETTPQDEPPAEEELVDLAPMAMDAPAEEIPTAADVDSDYDAELLEIFLEEADEIQEVVEKTLDQWSRDVGNLGHVAELQRGLHTLKGGARMANVAAVGDLAHVMESLLERIVDGLIAPEARFPALLQTCHDWLGEGLAQARQLRTVAPATQLLAQLEAAVRGEAAPQDVTSSAPLAESQTALDAEAAAPFDESLAVAVSDEAPAETALVEEELEDIAAVDVQRVSDATASEIPATVAVEEQVRVRADLLNDLVNYSGEVNIYNARIGQQLTAWRFNLVELDQTVSRLREQLRKFEIETETQIMYRHDTGGDTHAEDFDPLELDRFSTMQQLSRGMVESLGDLTSIQSMLDELSGDTDTLLRQQQRVTGELQEGLMHTRMVAFSSILPRLRRIVRQTATETDKQVTLEITGAEGEVDRTQLNRMIPALEHILRNAVDHGIETAAEREAAGKPANGVVRIDLVHQGSEVMLTVADDGRGLDIDALRAKAIEKGRLLPDADLSDRELMAFVLEAGFSTAKEVTQISGRGVGMDVVNTEIKQLGGTLHMETESGQGTRFEIRLPLTVLVNQALMVLVGEATYAIQLPNVEHVIRVSRDELVPMVDGTESHFEYAGNRYQYLSLSKALSGLPPTLPDSKQRIPLLLLRSGDHRIALQVDVLLGRQEIVIKSVGPQLSTVSVLSGATILPDGEVALILDVGNLVRSILAQQHADTVEPLLPVASEETLAAERRLTVMVVDDSITVRKVTERLLARYDYEVITAKDGVDALTVMLEQIPDIMLLDVEMPRMDGYELATTMRNDARLSLVPIIMITSRTGDKHRQRAMDIGVNEYMGKPFQEQDLIANIRALAGEPA